MTVQAIIIHLKRTIVTPSQLVSQIHFLQFFVLMSDPIKIQAHLSILWYSIITALLKTFQWRSITQRISKAFTRIYRLHNIACTSQTSPSATLVLTH